MSLLSIRVLAAAIALVSATGAPAAPATVKVSADFPARFGGTEIYDGTAWTNGWAQIGGLSVSTNADLSLHTVNGGGDLLDGTASTADGGVTSWNSANDGDWTFETALRFVAVPNGYALWVCPDTDRIVVEIYDTYTQDTGGESFATAHPANTDGRYHVYRIAHDGAANRYHVWRDDVRLTPPDGAPYDNTTDDSRLLMGDYTVGTFGNGFVVDVAYVRYDQTGAYAPRVVVDNEAGASNLTATGAALVGELRIAEVSPTFATVFWGETDAGTNAAAWANTNAFGAVAPGMLSTNVVLSEGTTYYYRFYSSNAAETAWAPRSATFATPFNVVVTAAATADASEDGPTAGTFMFTRTNTNGALTIAFAVDASSTAREGADYASMAPHTATFAAGASNVTVQVEPLVDAYYYEGTETVAVTIQPGDSYSVGTPAGAVVNIEPATETPAWPFSPSRIEGVILWLDASDIDGDGRDDTLPDGAAVASWADKSGRGNDATQGAATLQPVLARRELNDHPVVRFDGRGDRLLTGTTASYTCLHDGSGSTIVAVFRSNVASSEALQWLLDDGGDTFTNVGMSFGIENRGADTDRLWWSIVRGGDNILLTDGAAYDGILPLQTWLLTVNAFGYERPGSDLRFYLDGVERASSEPVSPPPSTANATRALSIGARGDDGTLALNGDLAELLIYDKVLNSNELNYVGAYLELKYGLDTAYDPKVAAVETRPPTEVTTRGATLNGVLVGVAEATVRVYWGEADGGTNAASWAHTNDVGVVAQGAVATNVALVADRRYFYRLQAAVAGSDEVWAPASESFITGEVSVRAEDGIAAERPSDAGEVVVSRPDVATNESLVVWLAYAGTAEAGVDYAGAVSELVFAPGEREKMLVLSPIDDWVEGEGVETAAIRILEGPYAIAASTALVAIADAPARPARRSGDFAYRYECDTTHLENEDIDGDLNADWSFFSAARPTPWPDAPTGVVTNGAEVTHGTSLPTSIWNREAFDGDYTIECGIRAVAQTSTLGALGAMTIWATPSGVPVDTCLLYVGTNEVHYGVDGAHLLGSFDNHTAFHSYRVARRHPAGGAVQFWIWRDGELLNPDGKPLPNALDEYQGRDMVLLGDTSGAMSGVWELDYVRLEHGAWSWAPPAPAGTLLMVR